MKYNCENGNLIIYFSGRITSTEADLLSKEINEIIETNTFSVLTGNMEDLEYISSAGLRVILSILKKNPSFNLIEVRPEVYEVFDVSGFSQMLPVKKAMRAISTKDATLLGTGFFSEVYRIDSETIVKKYIRGTSLEDIERECMLAKKAFVCGLPCAITYDVVKVDEAYGVVFEALNAGTFLSELKTDKSKLDVITDDNAELFKQMHKTCGDREFFPDASKIWKNKLEKIKNILSEEEYEKMHGLLDALKITDNFIHSDCHIGNIMRNGDEYMLIDMDTLSIGNPIFEFAPIFCTYEVFSQYDPNNSMEFLGIERELAKKIFYDIYDKYFSGINEKDRLENLDKIKLLGYFHQVFWITENTPDNHGFLDFSYAQFKNFLAKVDDLNLVY